MTFIETNINSPHQPWRCHDFEMKKGFPVQGNPLILCNKYFSNGVARNAITPNPENN